MKPSLHVRMSKQKRRSALFDFRRAAMSCVIALIILTVSFAYGQTTPTADNAPQLAIDRTSHDFGDVFVGEILSTVFRVRNLGAKALELSDRPIITPRRVSYRAVENAISPSFAKAGISASRRRAAPS